MASRGSKVLATEFNALQTKISNILGTGSGVNGYGQTVTSSQVVASSKISVTQWNALRTDMLACYYHLGLSQTVPVAPTTSRSVTYDDYNLYNTIINAVDASPALFPAAGNYSGTVLDAPTMTNMAYGTHTHNVTISFASADQFRYFFNAGGRIEITPTIAGGGLTTPDSSTLLDQAWQTIFNRMGSAYLYQSSTTVTNTNYTSGPNQSVTVASSVGANQLTTTFQAIATSITPAGGNYSPNQYQITAKVNVTPNPTSISFQIIFTDTSTWTGGVWAVKEPVDSTITDTVSYTRASGSYVSVVPPTLTSSSFT